MGRDIHLYLETDSKSTSGFGEPESFAADRVWIPRSYRLFQALGGLERVDFRVCSFTPGEPRPIFAPRGLPDPCSDPVSRQYYLPIRFPDEDDPWGPFDVASPEQAARWVESGVSIFADSPVRQNSLVSNPDWHTPSWLFEREVTAALAGCAYPEDELSLEFRAVLHLLRFFDQQLGPDRARIVFWFDN